MKQRSAFGRPLAKAQSTEKSNKHLGHEISLVSALENEAQNLISNHNFNATGYTFDCVGDQAQLGRFSHL